MHIQMYDSTGSFCSFMLGFHAQLSSHKPGGQGSGKTKWISNDQQFLARLLERLLMRPNLVAFNFAL